jgi:antitoxin VapB
VEAHCPPWRDFVGSEARISRIDDKVISEPKEKPPFDVNKWRATLDGYLSIDFPDIERLPPPEPDEEVSFDRSCSSDPR